MVELPYSDIPYVLLKTVNTTTWALWLRQYDEYLKPSTTIGKIPISVGYGSKVLIDYGMPYIYIPFANFKSYLNVKYEINEAQYK